MKSKETDNTLSEILSMSPNWQVKKKSIEDLSENSKLTLKSKYERVKQALKEKFLVYCTRASSKFTRHFVKDLWLACFTVPRYC